ncbi:flavin reductase family protein [Patiriisocius marinus]|uniref:Flavin reductase n=1 Tax=Patiriisocius marinus TaxID=1397112 RepID=A0A5J4IR89_9FLAO|nr:flavin reductase family protein [Patiriisocius marinus]GER60349.1 flavin reductase [Patiriisocius marinus]
MITIDPKEVSTGVLHGYLLSAVAPRPIAFASTIDHDGNVNLSPFSFFNVFSANPPILIFSPARRVRDNTIKHTLENVAATKEVVVNIVDYAMVQQMSLSSTEYAKGVNEFVKSGFTEVASETVKPPRVGEAPVQLECKVNDIIELGTEGGAGNLVICEVLKVHVKKEILDKNGKIDPVKLDAVSRMGGNWYGRSKEGMFEVPKPLQSLGIGFDSLPVSIRESAVLTGNDLAMLANVDALPKGISGNLQCTVTQQETAKDFLQKGQVDQAWNALCN